MTPKPGDDPDNETEAELRDMKREDEKAAAMDFCEHGVPYVHQTEFCPVCLDVAMGRVPPSQEISCEWCNDKCKWRIFCRDNQYERYACDKHQAKVRRQAQLDGYYPADLEEAWCLAGHYLDSDRIYK